MDAEVVRLEMTAPAGCPAKEAVEGRLDEQLNDPRFGEVRAVLEIERGGEGTVEFVAALLVETELGVSERALEAAECDAIVDASVLIVAMVAYEVVEREQAQEQEEGQEEEEEEEQEEEQEQEKDMPREVAAPVRPRVRALVSVEGGGGFGGVAPAGGLLGGAVGLTTFRLRAEVTGRFLFARRVRHASEAGVGANVQAWTIGARVGPVLHVRNVEFLIRGGFAAGLARAAGFGVSAPRTARRAWVSVGLDPAIVWRVTPSVGLGVGAELHGVLLRPQFTFADAGQLPPAGPVAAAATASFEWRFAGGKKE